VTDLSPLPPSHPREVDVHPIEDVADLQRLMVGEALSGPMRVLVWRDGDVRAITVEPAELEAA
jgi:hypothetical protein